MNTIEAQNTLVTSGGDIPSRDGSISYSAGQIIQQTTIGINGSNIQGIQFFFRSPTLQVIDFKTQLDIATYPNPTTSVVNLKINNTEDQHIVYELNDVLGKVLIKQNVVQNQTQINLMNFPNAVYILKIRNHENKILKTLKIIKNKLL